MVRMARDVRVVAIMLGVRDHPVQYFGSNDLTWVAKPLVPLGRFEVVSDDGAHRGWIKVHWCDSSCPNWQGRDRDRDRLTVKDAHGEHLDCVDDYGAAIDVIFTGEGLHGPDGNTACGGDSGTHCCFKYLRGEQMESDKMNRRRP